MKLSALMVGAVLTGATVVPNKSQINLHYLDRNYTPDAGCPGGQVRVTGPRFVEKGLNEEGLPGLDERAKGDGLSKKENNICIPLAELNKEREWAKSVYVTRVATGTKNEGTSFLVGDNVILTNHHIAVPLPKDPSDCRALEVYTRTDKPVWVKCSRILYCNATQDFCFVEMKDVSPGVKLGDLSHPLTLKADPITNEDGYLIGNSDADGIQGSRGPIVGDVILTKKANLVQGEFIHYIPMVGGASGSPIFNLKGEVIGINHAHKSFDGKYNDYIDPNGDTFNIGVSMRFIAQDLTNHSYAPIYNSLNFFMTYQLLRFFQ